MLFSLLRLFRREKRPESPDHLISARDNFLNLIWFRGREGIVNLLRGALEGFAYATSSSIMSKPRRAAGSLKAIRAGTRRQTLHW